MPAELIIRGDNGPHLASELSNFIVAMHTNLSQMSGGKFPIPAAPAAPAAPQPKTQAESAPAPKPEAEAAAPAKTPAKKAAKAPAEKPAAPEVELPESEEPTLDNARLWIRAVCAKAQADSDAATPKEKEEVGLDRAANILSKFKAKKVGEVKSADFAGFIATCKAYLTGEEAAAPAKKPSAADVFA